MFTYNLIMRTPDANNIYQDEAIEAVTMSPGTLQSLLDSVDIPMTARCYTLVFVDGQDRVMNAQAYDTTNRRHAEHIRMNQFAPAPKHILIITSEDPELANAYRHQPIQAGERLDVSTTIEHIQVNTPWITPLRGASLSVIRTNADAIEGNARLNRAIAERGQRNYAAAFGAHEGRISRSMVILVAPAIHATHGTSVHIVEYREMKMIIGVVESEASIADVYPALLTAYINTQRDMSQAQLLATIERGNDTLTQQDAQMVAVRAHYTQQITRSQPMVQDNIQRMIAGQTPIDIEAARRMIGDIASNPNVIGIRFDRPTSMMIDTTRQSAEGRDLGAYRITFEADGTQQLSHRLTFTNHTRRVQGRPHPHVNGGSCLGNTQEMVISALNQDEIGIAVSYLIKYVGDVNVNDQWGRQIAHWPRVGSVHAIFNTALTQDTQPPRNQEDLDQRDHDDDDDDDDDNHDWDRDEDNDDPED